MARSLARHEVQASQNEEIIQRLKQRVEQLEGAVNAAGIALPDGEVGAKRARH